MAIQMRLALDMATLSPEEKLHAAYRRCRALARRVPFENAVSEPLLRHCLLLTATSMQRAEERGEIDKQKRGRGR